MFLCGKCHVQISCNNNSDDDDDDDDNNNNNNEGRFVREQTALNRLLIGHAHAYYIFLIKTQLLQANKVFLTLEDILTHQKTILPCLTTFTHIVFCKA